MQWSWMPQILGKKKLLKICKKSINTHTKSFSRKLGSIFETKRFQASLTRIVSIINPKKASFDHKKMWELKYNSRILTKNSENYPKCDE